MNLENLKPVGVMSPTWLPVPRYERPAGYIGRRAILAASLA
jgi:hypothetical protein